MTYNLAMMNSLKKEELTNQKSINSEHNMGNNVDRLELNNNCQSVFYQISQKTGQIADIFNSVTLTVILTLKVHKINIISKYSNLSIRIVNKHAITTHTVE